MASKLNASLRGLRTFCIAARYESFRVAAPELFITSSAVSHQIKSLEEELGVKLFERGGRELKLTEIGAAMFAEINPLIEKLDVIVGNYREGGMRKSIRMSVQPFFASEYFIPRLSDFSAEHPDIDIQVETSDESSEKHPADADVSIRLFKSPPEGARSIGHGRRLHIHRTASGLARLQLLEHRSYVRFITQGRTLSGTVLYIPVLKSP